MTLNTEDHMMIVAMAKAILPLAAQRDPALALRIETALENDYAELKVTVERTDRADPPSNAAITEAFNIMKRPSAYRQSTNSILDETATALGVSVPHVGPSGA
jgi:hypothetical protein